MDLTTLYAFSDARMKICFGIVSYIFTAVSFAVPVARMNSSHVIVREKFSHHCERKVLTSLREKSSLQQNNGYIHLLLVVHGDTQQHHHFFV